jgi:LuxR family maltose regulon positive regulatory protein
VSGIVDHALALYQGDFLAGDDSHPDVLVARNRLRALFVRQMATLGVLLEAQGRPEPAALVYRRVIEREPLSEDMVRRLMRCLQKLGLRAEAYEAYRTCRQQLSVVLGIRPSAETEALAATLREA